MSNDTVHYELTINLNEAKSGTKRILIRKDKRLEVTIPAGVSNGSVLKLTGALQITDDIYDDIIIHIRVRKHYRKRVFKTFGFWSLILCIPGIFINTEYGGYYPVSNQVFFLTAVILGVLQFRRYVSKYSIAGFALGLAGLVFSGVLMVHILNYPPSPSHIYTVDHWGDEVRVTGGDYRPIELVNNPYAENPSYDELLAFIQTETTNEKLFIHTFFWGYICTDYAEDVHNNAEAAGIRAALVVIYFEEDEMGHALNAFETIDKGLVYIDCTSWDTVAYIEKGKEYGCIDLDEVYSTEYSYYEKNKQIWQLIYPSPGIVEEIQINW